MAYPASQAGLRKEALQTFGARPVVSGWTQVASRASLVASRSHLFACGANMLAVIAVCS